MTKRICTAPDCDRPLRSALHCGRHHSRMLRYGSLDLPKKQRLSTSGYRRAPGCREYEHRVILLAIIGPEPHPCHWCNRMLTWGLDLEADHLDEDKLNNDPHNLVPACSRCNAGRSHWAKRMEACKKGHPYTPENTRLRQRGEWTVRDCRECNRAYRREYMRRVRGTGPKPGRRPVSLGYELRQEELAVTGQAENQCPDCGAWCRDGRIVSKHRRGCPAVAGNVAGHR